MIGLKDELQFPTHQQPLGKVPKILLLDKGTGCPSLKKKWADDFSARLKKLLLTPDAQTVRYGHVGFPILALEVGQMPTPSANQHDQAPAT